jgi:hypothetical protein
MRFMVIVKANEKSEAGVLPSTELIEAMGRFNAELAKSGVLLAAEGLHASSKAARVRFTGNDRIVTYGPFDNAEELVSGFWLWRVDSREEAIEWLKSAPFDGGTEVEIRQVFEADDFGPALTPELREEEERLKKELSGEET